MSHKINIFRTYARSLAFLVASLPAAIGAAAASECPKLFFDGAPPTLSKAALRADTQEICYMHFAVLHSGVSHTPLWSAEHLTRDDVAAAHDMVREDVFHPEPSLPPGDRAELEDYRGSGYDRGHMAPSGDMPDAQSQAESFTLANMVPQNPDNNRRLWAGIEKTVRDLAARTGEIYIVTGPIFDGESVSRLHGRVMVPTRIFKAVYVPATGQAGAYVSANAAGDDWRRVSLADLETLSGVVTFPALNGGARSSAPDFLPAPFMRGHGAFSGHAASSSDAVNGEAGKTGAIKNMIDAVKEKGMDGVKDAARAWTADALRKGLDRLTRGKGENVENPYNGQNR